MKKYSKYLFLILCILIFLFSCNKIKNNQVYKDESIKDNQEDLITSINEIEEVEDDITIVIDPGHSSIGNFEKEQIAPDSNETKVKDVIGATGNYTKVPEYQTNLSVGLLLKKELDERGYNVIMTKTEVEQSLSNIERANVGNKNKADLVVRIHSDSNENTAIKGASMQVPAKNQYTESFYDISKEYGEKIINTYATQLNLVNRGLVYRGDLTGFNWSKVPVVLLEMGFLSNEEDDIFVSNIKNHEKIAKVIADGIDKCFE